MTLPLLAQQNQLKEMQMFLDFARFRYDDTHTYLEIYYVLYNRSEQGIADKKDLRLAFYLSNMNNDSLLASDEFWISLHPGEIKAGNLKGRAKGSLIKTVLPPGKYQIKMVRMNISGDQALDSIQHVFSTAPFKSESIALSDLELCSNILTGADHKDDLFYKNTMAVYPNPTHIYGSENPNLYYYIELYNINNVTDSDAGSGSDSSASSLNSNPNASDGKLEVQVAIKDNKGKIYDQKVYKRDRNYESLVEQGKFNVSDLDNGIYTLMFAVVDPQSEYSVFRLNNFHIVNQDRVATDQSDMMTLFPESIYYDMPEEIVDKRFEQAKYIINKKTIGIYESIDSVQSKRLVMYKFWHEKEMGDPDFQQEYYARVDYANEHFREFGKEGWRTDRGRVYVVYGKPSESISRISSARDEPFEIWIYHELEGGVRFLFVDELGFDSYRLVSSTLRGEIYDPAWDEYLNILVEH